MNIRKGAFAIFLTIALIFTFTPNVAVSSFAKSDNPPSMNLGADVLQTNAGQSGAQIVRFFGRFINTQDPDDKNEKNRWYVIAYDGKDGSGSPLTYQNASGEEKPLYDGGTITLLYKGDDWLGTYSADINNPDNYNGSNVYATSNAKSFLDLYAPLYPMELAAIVPRYIYGGGSLSTTGTYDKNLVMGDDVSNALLWPLSHAEAEKLPKEIMFGNNSWWLRSPGARDTDIGFVYVDSTDVENTHIDFGGTFSWTGVIRPAMNLNMDAVCFTCATNDGKQSGAIGPDSLLTVNKTSEKDWTLTLYDDGRIPGLQAHRDFKVTESEYDESSGTVSLKYEGVPVPTEDESYYLHEYVSAIILGADGKIKYYGKIAEITHDDSADGEATINLTGKLSGSDKLLVFSERQFYGQVPMSLGPSDSSIRTEFASGLYEIPTSTADPDSNKPDVSGDLLAQLKSEGKTSLNLTWNEVTGADGYDVFFGKCGGKKGKHDNNCTLVDTVTAGNTLSWIGNSLKKKTAYCAYVKAYVMKDGSKQYVRTAATVHAFTSGGNGKYTNPKSVNVKKTKISLRQGKTYKIKAKVKKLKKNKKLIPKQHAKALRYLSSDTGIATVSKSGKIRGKSKGSCKVYVYSVNGVYKTLNVTVK